MKKAEAKGVKLMLPVDTKVGKEFDANTESQTVKYTEIPDGWEGFDIGQETIELYASELKNAKTVIWNGPVGLFEFDQFAIGTNSIAKKKSYRQHHQLQCQPFGGTGCFGIFCPQLF